MNCHLYDLGSQFNFGKFNGFSLADVLSIHPGYVRWCVTQCDHVLLYDSAIEQIKQVYPHFHMDNLFNECRQRNLDNCSNVKDM